MAVILPHTTRATGTILTSTIYNADHQVHITNANALNAELSAIVGVGAATGIIASNGAGVISGRSIASGNANITVSNANGVAGNPTVTLAGALALATSLTAPFVTATNTGSAAAPSLRTGNTTTGLYGSASLEFAISGINRGSLSNAGLLTVASITTSGNVTIGGDLIVTGADITGVSRLAAPTTLTIAANATTIFMRPNGVGSAVGETSINNLGDMNVDGDVVAASSIVTVAGGMHTNNKFAANPATAGCSLTDSGQAVFAINDVFLIGNRLSSDGSLVHLRQANVTDGTISTAAGVVTYGTFFGSHWSQPFYVDQTSELLKGTIVDSVKELCWWEGEADVGQPNLHLPKFKISNTPGSKKVYGVVAWEDEDGDWFIGALGAYMVRMQAGQTVNIGDYVESAGDGCGRVQTDDILRASTVAKITSTEVAETYPDGSFLLPCTLHCG